MKSTKIRKWLLISWLTILLTAITGLFWYNEFIYSLPTPVPKNYNPIKPGEFVDLSKKLPSANNKPVFLHFFNPSCPCSKFNIPHIQSLVKQYGSKISCAIVVLNKRNNWTEEEIQDKFDLKIPVLFAQDLADKCGVYATPQAVILDAEHKLYYRGNYNKSRYCTDVKTYFAQIAIDSLLNNYPSPLFNQIATIAYGCKLPMCKK